MAKNKKSAAAAAPEKRPQPPQLVRAKGEARGKPLSLSKKSGLVLSVIRVLRNLKIKRYAERVPKGAAIYLTAVLEYLVAEKLELAGNCAKQLNKQRITPRHIKMAVVNDEELSMLLKNVTYPDAGVNPYIHPVLLPPKKAKREDADD